MASVNDIHNFSDQFQYQLRKLDDADIDERDRKAIKELIRYQDTQRNLAASTNVNNCSDLRLSAERADTPLVDMERSDVDELLFRYKHEREMAEGTLRNYRKAFRKFFRYHDRGWAEDIEIGAIPDREVDADKTLTEEEIEALRESADHSRNKALLELLIDTGLQISAIGTLRVQDVDLNGRAGTVTLNQEAVGRKGASGKRPLTWSKPYVANWLDIHPRNDDPDAPLFHRLTMPNGGWDDDDDGVLTYYTLQKILKQIAEDAGVDRDKANPHNFRKTAISQWIRQGFSEQEIKHRATWVKDSRQFETYSQVTDEEMNQQILEQYGLAEQESERNKPDIDDCPQCQATLRGDPRFCPGCGLALSQKAAHDLEKAEDDVFEDMAAATEEDEVEMLRDLRELVQERPDAVEEALRASSGDGGA
ncbi:integrase [Halorubrum sp. BOL3-1]|uniref:site-specific integrase n=1 Tax=Halorubrum sp. BOL3-1 TaxID=2497325 RepID=UPI0010050CAE|nr:site-specific integrase [Halorubrum sp. BOL3-1]QAU12831.1 integrase [Halorubrum sp. BOL3-1]